MNSADKTTSRANAGYPDIFVVDDEPLIASGLAQILGLNGFSAEAFTDPLEALAAAQRRCPRLLITDVKMPKLSGLELAIRISKSCTECKILFFPGEVNISDRLPDEHLPGGNSFVLQKPSVPSELLLIVGKILGSSASAK